MSAGMAIAEAMAAMITAIELRERPIFMNPDVSPASTVD